MATETNEQTRKERFIAWNPYAAKLHARGEANVTPGTGEVVGALLAVAYEIAQLRAQIRFGNGRSQSS